MVLQARFKERRAGHWVVFKTVYEGATLIAMAYAWSMKGVSYILSTCRSTEPDNQLYTSYFEDENGHVAFNEIQRPKLANMIYDHLPIIDEHNKQRQDILGLERRFPTKNAWFRLKTTLIGMCAVDLHRFLFHKKRRWKICYC